MPACLPEALQATVFALRRNMRFQFSLQLVRIEACSSGFYGFTCIEP